MNLSENDVRHIALLSRLEVTEEQVTRYTQELSKIFNHFETLKAIDTASVPPTSHAIPTENVFRKDEPRPSLTPEEALANAPDQYANCFKVPQLI